MTKLKIITKVCKTHGKAEFILEGRGYYRCKQCRVGNVTRCRKNRKIQAIDYKGGCCKLCGYHKCPEALEFHHLDSNEKDFQIAISMAAGWAWERIKSELDKCVMLCANCHREVHSGVAELVNAPHC